ncbi:GtrA family protein [Microbacter sp. GSS18]|nr:GtrA family protein [Microbacter sp. GSS18]
MPQESLGRRTKEVAAFLVVGLVAFFVDAAVYNILVFWVTGQGVLYDYPLTAKIISIAVASVATYIGNRFWTFGSRHLPHRWSRYVLFVVFNVTAILLQLGCLAFSRYVLGLEGPVPDNISGTFIGQIVATVFRFATYDRFVFRPEPEPAQAEPA